MTEPVHIQPWGPHDPFGYHNPSQWPVLDGARSRMATALLMLKRLEATPAEQAALIPALRRKAVLDAAQSQGTELRLPIGLLLLVLLVGAPVATLSITRSELTAGGLALTYLWYLPSLIAWLIAAIFAAVLITFGFESRQRWLMSIVALVFAAGVTAGLVVLFGKVRDNDSNLLAAFFAAWLFISLAVLVLIVEVPLAEERERRRHGALGIHASAALVLFEEWQILANHRRNWRTGAGRRDLAHRLSTLAKDAETQLERSARVNTGDGPARLWAEAYLIKLSNLLRDHRHQLLLIDQRGQYEELIRRVRTTAVDLAEGRWGPVGLAGYQQRLTLRRRLLRFVPALGLGLAALGVGYVPGIDKENLLTIQLTLIIPAVLSLLKVGELSKSTLGDTLREAADRVKG